MQENHRFQWDKRTIWHEGPDFNMIKIWNLCRNIDNRGNQWWIFSHNDIPIETWSTKSRALSALRSMNVFLKKYNVPNAKLFRCLPGVGFYEVL